MIKKQKKKTGGIGRRMADFAPIVESEKENFKENSSFAETLPTLTDDPYGDSKLGRLGKAIKKLVIDVDLEKDAKKKKKLEDQLQKLRDTRSKVVQKGGEGT